MKRTILIALFALAIPQKVEAARLTGAQMQKEYAGKSFSFRTRKGATGNTRYFKNGKARLSNTNFKPKSDRGTWRIKGNRFCNTWKIIRGGKEKCFSITKIGTGKYRNQDGTIISRR